MTNRKSSNVCPVCGEHLQMCCTISKHPGYVVHCPTCGGFGPEINKRRAWAAAKTAHTDYMRYVSNIQRWLDAHERKFLRSGARTRDNANL
jgi:transcription elongation factor Elf1